MNKKTSAGTPKITQTCSNRSFITFLVYSGGRQGFIRRLIS
jgi:hypothetical protein